MAVCDAHTDSDRIDPGATKAWQQEQPWPMRSRGMEGSTGDLSDAVEEALEAWLSQQGKQSPKRQGGKAISRYNRAMLQFYLNTSSPGLSLGKSFSHRFIRKIKFVGKSRY